MMPGRRRQLGSSCAILLLISILVFLRTRMAAAPNLKFLVVPAIEKHTATVIFVHVDLIVDLGVDIDDFCRVLGILAMDGSP